METSTNRTWMAARILWAVMVMFVASGAPAAQEHIDAEHIDAVVQGDAATPDFITIATFLTPTGAGADRKTIARIVTPLPTASVMFEIAPPVGTGKSAVEISVDGSARFIRVGEMGPTVATTVVAQLMGNEYLLQAFSGSPGVECNRRRA